MGKQIAIVVFGGFLTWAGPRTGVHALAQKIEHEFYDRRRSNVFLRTWDSDHHELAALIDFADPRKVAVIGHSYGIGWGALKLAEQLNELGRSIDMLFAIDPVPRFRIPPAKLLSLTSWGKVYVPANVREAWNWRLRKGQAFAPDGRDLAAVDKSKTTVHPPVLIDGAGVTHNTIDERESIHASIIETLRERVGLEVR